MGRGWRGWVAAAAAAAVPAWTVARAQAPDDRWRTFDTPHFRVHHTPELELLARRAAGAGEVAWARLAAELPPPRQRVELVVADNQDVSNGFANPFPYPRVVVYARPPVDVNPLRFVDDWITLVVAHELLHIFHLDRARGVWALGRRLFGRAPWLFPNFYSPSWLIEGLAVYYETALTGAGRLAGPDHRALARAAALEGALPAADQLSAATGRFPLANTPYVYGSLLIEAMAQRGGAGAVGRFVEASAGSLIPIWLDRHARTGFGQSFSAAYRAWSDSVRRSVAGLAPSPARRLRTEGWAVRFPRWDPTGGVWYTANDTRAFPGLYRIDTTPGARPRRVGRRNGLDVNGADTSGAVVFAQPDLTDPWRERSDLYVERDGVERRVTRGARVAQPHVRADGAVVAVQTVPGSTRLVRVAADGTVRPLTSASLDTVWAEPRWSRDGRRIAAARWTRGNATALVVLDSTGQQLHELAAGRGVTAAPSWGAGDSSLVFVSDRDGASALYEVALSSGAVRRLARSPTGFFQPDVAADGRIALLEFSSRGWEVAVLDGAALEQTPVPPTAAPSAAPPPPVLAGGAARPYSAWRTVLPRWWGPAIGTTDEGSTLWGAFSSGADAVGRHAWSAQAQVDGERGQWHGLGSYRYAGLGNPVLDVGYEHAWDHFAVLDSARRSQGTLSRRRGITQVAATLLRPRLRTNAWVTVGGEAERRDFATDPAPLLSRLTASPANALLGEVLWYPALFASAGWGNLQVPTLAISPEDGVSVSATVRQRWRSGAPGASAATSAVVAAAAYKSLDLPGFAHHVVAVRGALGTATERQSSEFSVGGVSGTSLTVVPGLTVGDARRTFFVRGFAPGTQRGLRAAAGSAEYRLPLSFPGRGLGLWPLFLQRLSGTVFADAGSAWCPAGWRASPVCPARGIERQWLASVGAELHADAAFDWDLPYRLRAGVARPVRGGDGRGASGYVSVGLPF